LLKVYFSYQSFMCFPILRRPSLIFSSPIARWKVSINLANYNAWMSTYTWWCVAIVWSQRIWPPNWHSLTIALAIGKWFVMGLFTATSIVKGSCPLGMFSSRNWEYLPTSTCKSTSPSLSFYPIYHISPMLHTYYILPNLPNKLIT
jgi:hypothetical protein